MLLRVRSPVPAPVPVCTGECARCPSQTRSRARRAHNGAPRPPRTQRHTDGERTRAARPSARVNNIERAGAREGPQTTLRRAIHREKRASRGGEGGALRGSERDSRRNCQGQPLPPTDPGTERVILRGPAPSSASALPSGPEGRVPRGIARERGSKDRASVKRSTDG